jgi:hypothetical protein
MRDRLRARRRIERAGHQVLHRVGVEALHVPSLWHVPPAAMAVCLRWTPSTA